MLRKLLKATQVPEENAPLTGLTRTLYTQLWNDTMLVFLIVSPLAISQEISGPNFGTTSTAIASYLTAAYQARDLTAPWLSPTKLGPHMVSDSLFQFAQDSWSLEQTSSCFVRASLSQLTVPFLGQSLTRQWVSESVDEALS